MKLAVTLTLTGGVLLRAAAGSSVAAQSPSTSRAPELESDRTTTSKKRNVLLLIADDLRPQLNRAYGMDEMHTPNLDAFADTALTFDHA